MDLKGKEVEIFSGDAVGRGGKVRAINCIVGIIPFEGEISRKLHPGRSRNPVPVNPYDPLLKVEEAVQTVCDEGIKGPKIRAASDKVRGFLPLCQEGQKALGRRKEEAAALPHAL